MNRTKLALWVLDRLRAQYGAPDIGSSAPLETLIRTILSQNTNDVNRDRAYTSLMRRFGTLENVRRAPEAEIAAAIRSGGLYTQKAERIRKILDRITTEQGGNLDLSFLANLEVEEAMAWLLASPGIGRKTAGIVALFSFGKPYFPVDTHIRRVFSRLGIIGPKDDPHVTMNTLLPRDPKVMASLHLLTIRLGRETCRPRKPACLSCPLHEHCGWFRENRLDNRPDWRKTEEGEP